MEALWETTEGAPLVLFAVPDEEERTNKYAIELPNMASLILTHHMEGEVKGLNEFEGNHPPVAPVFWGFRIMVGMGILMLLVSWAGLFFIWKKDDLPKLYARCLIGMTFSGWIATLSGWYVTEIGRQPWLVYGVLRTHEALAPVPGAHVGISLTGYLIVYVLLLGAYIGTLFYMSGKAEKFEKSGQEEIESRWSIENK